jgi:multimeric flavodoxin WrbA
MNPETNQQAGGGEHPQDAVKPGLRITAVCGSLSKKSTTKMALDLALKGAAEYDVDTSLIHLRDYKLVFYGEVEEENYPPDVLKLRKVIKESNALIIGTPEYHGSLSGALKNMLDLMGQQEFEGKIVGIVGVAGGHTGAINSLNTKDTPVVIPDDPGLGKYREEFAGLIGTLQEHPSEGPGGKWL